ncbi:uncharacterized protein N7515_004817 [Penicillium bovifimosum]|uniref:Uncharacterized protein n=1 Tax=Penicillium bovifimosum TaxID=126998 RepID=A0A9W9L4B9_9EURO|nr:uncharacterized protein N7515_004817 [Penicillium bovifimosum]KAJ5135539.1 hypothetical protein N7515_004817 [Penicillium bovifimosum]
MLAHLSNIFTPSTSPSVLLVIGKFGATIHILHLLPESRTIERFSLITPSSITTFRHHGAREQAREQIGIVTLHVGDGETANSFLDDVETNPVEVAQLVQDVLQPAALDAIHERVERDRSMRATQTYPVFVVYIIRSSAGTSLTELTSFP